MVNPQVSTCSVAQSALDDVQAQAAAAEEKLQRADTALARLLTGDRTAGLTAEMAKLQEDIGALRKVCLPWILALHASRASSCANNASPNGNVEPDLRHCSHLKML